MQNESELSSPTGEWFGLSDLREVAARDLPGLGPVPARDDSHPDTESMPSSGDSATHSLAGFGYLIGVALTALADASPASDEPEMKIMGKSFADSGGVIFSLSTL